MMERQELRGFPQDVQTTHWLDGPDGTPGCWASHRLCARHKVEQLTQRAEVAEQQAAALRRLLVIDTRLEDGTMGRGCRLCLGRWETGAESVHDTDCPVLAAAVARAADLEAERDQYRAAVAAADDLVRVLEQEVMPRYMELIDAYGLGDSVVDPMSRQALDAYRDARAALAGQPAAPVAGGGGE